MRCKVIPRANAFLSPACFNWRRHSIYTCRLLLLWLLPTVDEWIPMLYTA